MYNIVLVIDNKVLFKIQLDILHSMAQFKI